MTAIDGDIRVAQWLGGVHDRDQTRAQIASWVAHWDLHGFGQWAVEERATAQLVGRAGLTHHNDWKASSLDAEIGWALAHSAWGRGYATEAAQAVLEWVRGRPNLKTIISITRPDNVRSRRVMEKLGLTYRGEATWHGSHQVWYDNLVTPEGDG